MKTLQDCNPGDVVFVQKEYNLEKAYFIKLNKKSVKVRYDYQDFNTKQVKSVEVNEKIEKVAHAEEKIAVIWEQWKGVNGRGGYRLDKSMYPALHREAQNWPHQALLYEESYGKITNDNLTASENNQKNLKQLLKLLK